MDTSTPVDTHVALNQWEALRQTYKELGHTVELVEPVAGLPDMVYAANGGLSSTARPWSRASPIPQRAGESIAYAEWMARHGYDPPRPATSTKARATYWWSGRSCWRATDFRTDRRAHDEIADARAACRSSACELVDPRFYHLDTALAVLDDTTIAYYPPAFSPASRARLLELFPDAIEVATADADVFGLNAVSDGRNVVLPAAATGFADQLREAGFRPIGVDLSELLKGGGSVKCCTLEVHP